MSYDINGLGYNYRLDDMRAAIGIVQFGRLQKFIECRAQVVEMYKNRLSEIENVIVPAFRIKKIRRITFFQFW